MERVQIVIPVINLWNKYSKRCIDSVVEACEGLDYRILLIDKCSTDETKEEAGKLVSSRFAHHRDEVNLSLSTSWNFGAQDGFDRGYEYIYIINNDVILHKNAIKELIAEFKQNDEKVILISSMDVRGECTNPEDVLLMDETLKKDVEKAESPCYSGFMITRKYWDIVGPFDVDFYPAYFEDNDSHYRVNISGHKAIVKPTSLFYHYGSATQKEANAPDVTNTNFEKNRERYIKKWGGLPGQETYKTPFNE